MLMIKGRIVEHATGDARREFSM